MQAAAEGSLLAASPPSFNSYSSDKLAMVAARVIQEFHRDSHHSLSSEHNRAPAACHLKGIFGSWNSDEDGNFLQQIQRIHADHNCEDGNGIREGVDEGDDDFEFASVSRDEANASPISADAVFHNGQIKPMYPIFDQSLLIDYATNGVMDDANEDESASNGLKPVTVSNDKGRHRRPPLKKLMFEERGTVLCSSWVSEDVNDLDRLQPGTYCVWNPKPGRESSCKKSRSTGFSSKRWNLRNLLVRSRSDGKRSYVCE